MCICLYQQVVWSAPTSLHQGTERSQAKFWFIWGESTNACFKHCCSTKVESNDLLLWGEQNRSLNVLYRSRHLWRYAMRLKAAHRGCRRLGDDRTYRWDKNEENLVWISIKLALIFSLITVSDTESTCAVIKAHRAGWFSLSGLLIYLFGWQPHPSNIFLLEQNSEIFEERESACIAC